MKSDDSITKLLRKLEGRAEHSIKTQGAGLTEHRSTQSSTAQRDVALCSPWIPRALQTRGIEHVVAYNTITDLGNGKQKEGQRHKRL